MEWTDGNSVTRNTAHSRYHHVGRNACPTLVFLDPNGIPVPIFKAHYAAALGIPVDSSLSPTVQIDAKVTKSR